MSDHVYTPIIDCAHKNPADGCCSNPRNTTPECHLDSCPRLAPEVRRGRTPHRCPICEGHGNVPGGWHSALPGCESYGATTLAEQCRACGGTGLLWS